MNKQIILHSRPQGLPDATTWRVVDNEIPKCSEGQILVKLIYVSIDPAMRGWIRDQRSYLPPVALDDVMRAITAGVVIESKHEKFKVGDYVVGSGGVQQYVATSGKGWYPVQADLAPLPLFLSALGMTGFTAYFGLLEVGKPRPGETILVSGAAGAVGSMVGQIGKIKECRVVGIAGGEKKCRYIVDDLGFDAAIDYKNEDVRKSIKEHCPDGVDVFFDNVGGEILDAALTRINRKARIVVCGGISQYNSDEMRGPKNYYSILMNRARMEGFIVFDFAHQYETAARQLALWLSQGKIRSKEHIVEGIENFYQTFLRLFSGEKLGKLILKVNQD